MYNVGHGVRVGVRVAGLPDFSINLPQRESITGRVPPSLNGHEINGKDRRLDEEEEDEEETVLFPPPLSFIAPFVK